MQTNTPNFTFGSVATPVEAVIYASGTFGNTLSGTIVANGLTKFGPQSLTLSGVNTGVSGTPTGLGNASGNSLQGTITLNQGTLAATTGAAPNFRPVTLNAGVLQFNTANLYLNDITINGDASLDTGTNLLPRYNSVTVNARTGGSTDPVTLNTIADGLVSNLGLTLSGPVNLNHVTGGNQVILGNPYIAGSSALTGAGALNKFGAGQVVLATNSAGYTGRITINGLGGNNNNAVIRSFDALGTDRPFGTGAIVVNPGGILSISHTGNIASNASVTFNSDLNGLAGLAVNFNGNATLPGGLTFNNLTLNGPFSGVLAIDAIGYSGTVDLGVFGNGVAFLGSANQTGNFTGTLTPSGVGLTSSVPSTGLGSPYANSAATGVYRIGAGGGTTQFLSVNQFAASNDIQIGAISNVHQYTSVSLANGNGNAAIYNTNAGFNGKIILNGSTNTLSQGNLIVGNNGALGGGHLNLQSAATFSDQIAENNINRSGVGTLIIDPGTSTLAVAGNANNVRVIPNTLINVVVASANVNGILPGNIITQIAGVGGFATYTGAATGIGTLVAYSVPAQSGTLAPTTAASTVDVTGPITALTNPIQSVFGLRTNSSVTAPGTLKFSSVSLVNEGGLLVNGISTISTNLIFDPTNATAPVALANLTTTANSTTVTVTSTASLTPGLFVTGPNIPAGSFIQSITNGTQFVLNNSVGTAASGGTGSAIPGSSASGEGIVYVNPGSTATLTGSLLATSLVKFGSGNITLNGSSQSILGQLTVQEGTLRVSAASNFTKQQTDLVLNNTGALDLNGANATFNSLANTGVPLTGLTTVNANATVTVASTAGLQTGMIVLGPNIPAGATVLSITNATTFVLSANATAAAAGQIGNATIAGTIGGGVIGNGGAVPATFMVNGNNTTFFAGNIVDGLGAGTGTTALVKSGTGTLVLSIATPGNPDASVNTFTGGTTLYGYDANGANINSGLAANVLTTTVGSLVVQNPLGLGTGAINLVGGILNLQSNGGGINGTIILGGSGAGGGLGQTVNVYGPSSINVDRVGANTGNSWQIGNLNLTENTLTTTGGNSYHLRVNGTTAILGSFANINSGTTSPNGTMELVGQVTGTGALNKFGSDTSRMLLVDNGTNSYSGGTNVISVRLIVNTTTGTPLGTGRVNVFPGGMLSITGLDAGWAAGTIGGAPVRVNGYFNSLGLVGLDNDNFDPAPLLNAPNVLSNSYGTIGIALTRPFWTRSLDQSAIGDGRTFLTSGLFGEVDYIAPTLAPGLGDGIAPRTYRIAGGVSNTNFAFNGADNVFNDTSAAGTNMQVGSPTSTMLNGAVTNTGNFILIRNSNSYTGGTNKPIALQLGGNVYVEGTTTLGANDNYVNATFGVSNNVFGGLVQGGRLTKFGNAALLLSGTANTYGSTVINESTANTATSILGSLTRTGSPFGSGPITINPGGMLRVMDPSNIAGNAVSLRSDGISLGGIAISGNITPAALGTMIGTLAITSTGDYRGIVALDTNSWNSALSLAALETAAGGKIWLGSSMNPGQTYFNNGGQGIVRLSANSQGIGTSTYSGSTNVWGGRLQIAADTNFTGPAATPTIISGPLGTGALFLGRQGTTTGGAANQAPTFVEVDAFGADRTVLNALGAINQNGDTTVNGGTITSGSGVFTGTGTLSARGINSLGTGSITLQGGTLEFNNAIASNEIFTQVISILQGGSNGYDVFVPAANNFGSPNTTSAFSTASTVAWQAINSLTVNAPVMNWTGTSGNGVLVKGTTTFNQDTILNTTTVTVNQAVFAGTLTATGRTLSKIGAGTVFLTGTGNGSIGGAANSVGAWNVFAGTLEARTADGGSNPIGTNSVTLNGGTLAIRHDGDNLGDAQNLTTFISTNLTIGSTAAASSANYISSANATFNPGSLNGGTNKTIQFGQVQFGGPLGTAFLSVGQITAGYQTEFTGGLTMIKDAYLSLNNNTTTISASLSGNGTLFKQGTAELDINAVATNTGGTVLAGGTTNFANFRGNTRTLSTTAMLSGNITVQPGALIRFNSTTNVNGAQLVDVRSNLSNFGVIGIGDTAAASAYNVRVPQAFGAFPPSSSISQLNAHCSRLLASICPRLNAARQ